MSHMHHIDGISNTAAQYQAYLERMRAAHSAEEGDKVRKKFRSKRFKDILDPEEDEDADTGEGPSGGQQEEPEAEADTKEGFGNHYA